VELAEAPPPVPMMKAFSCRICRLRLFTAKDIVPHATPEEGKHFKGKRGKMSTVGGVHASLCTSYFLDPDVSPWVAEESRASVLSSGAASEAEFGDLDTIYCPGEKCRTKLGGRCWSGAQCSCGSWVTPAFRISQSRIEWFFVPAESE
jgi:dual specificity phosphatase 12